MHIRLYTNYETMSYFQLLNSTITWLDIFAAGKVKTLAVFDDNDVIS